MEQFRSIDSYERTCTDELEVLRSDRIAAYSEYFQQAIRDSERFNADAYRHANVIQFTC